MPRPRPHDDALRQTLVELASRAVSTGGSEGLSLRKLAAEAGTTTAAVYTLFGGRDGLVRAVVEEGFRRFAERLHAVPRTADPGADLFALGLAYRENAVTNPHFYRVMFGTVDGRDVAGVTTSDAAGDDGPHARGDGDNGGVDVPAVVSPTFSVLRDAVARLPAPARAEGTQEMALRLWALAHGLVSLELTGLLPGTAGERAARYRAALLVSRR